MKKVSILMIAVLVIAAMIATVVSAQGNGAEHASAVLVDPAGNVVGNAKFTEDATGILHVTAFYHTQRT